MRPPPVSILLLDDDQFTLDVLADMLRDLAAVEVRCASNAHSALAALAAQPPALLICDLSMPDMDGIEFLQAAAAAAYRGQVMLLSGMDAGVRRSAERLAQAQGLQVLGTFSKPISASELRAALARLTPPAPGADDNLYNATTRPGK